MKEIESFLGKPSRGFARWWREFCYFLVLRHRKSEIKCRRGGINFVLHPADKLAGQFRHFDKPARHIFKFGKFEPRQVGFLFQSSKDRGADIFLDIGANFGLYSLLAAKTKMFTEIHAFEPHPKVYPVLQACIKTNDFAHTITPYNIAASDTQGEMFIDDRARGSASVHKNTRPHLLPIWAMPLDSVFDFSERNIAIKMDIEGHECAALAGMANLIRRNNVFMQAEILEDSAAHVHSFIERGFRIHRRIGNDFYFSKDGKTAA